MLFVRAKWVPLAMWLSLIFLVADGGAQAASNDENRFIDNLDIVDSSLSGKIMVLRVGSDLGANKLLSVFAGLRNRTGRNLNLELETIYKDSFGNALNSGSWIAFTLKPREEREYHSSSISERATDFLVRVRRAQEAHP